MARSPPWWCVVLMALCSVSFSSWSSSSSSSPLLVGAVSVKCGECEEGRCPELHYCEGQAVKDHCGCCTVCSSSKYQPHPLLPPKGDREGSACQKVECPKFKVCVENVQGLPLCTCPSDYICRNRKRLKPVCGSDGITYESRCHLRIAACNSAVKVKVSRKGPCGGFHVPRQRACESFSTCRKRKNQHTVCGTDGKSYISRCHMKMVACQKGVKIRLKSVGTCPPSTDHAPSSRQHIGTSGVARDTGSLVVRTRRRDRVRKWKKSSGNDVSGSDDSKSSRRRRRREKRRKRKERRRKRRKARGKSRSRRFKHDKNLFHKTFGDITWK